MTKRMKPNISTFIADVTVILEISGVNISLSSCSIRLGRKDEQPTIRTAL